MHRLQLQMRADDALPVHENSPRRTCPEGNCEPDTPGLEHFLGAGRLWKLPESAILLQPTRALGPTLTSPGQTDAPKRANRQAGAPAWGLGLLTGASAVTWRGGGHVEEVIDQPLPPAGQGVEGGVCVEGAEERRRCHMSEGRDGQTQAKVKPGSLGL